MNCTMSISPYNYTALNSTWTCLKKMFSSLFGLIIGVKKFSFESSWPSSVPKQSLNKMFPVKFPGVWLLQEIILAFFGSLTISKNPFERLMSQVSGKVIISSTELPSFEDSLPTNAYRKYKTKNVFEKSCLKVKAQFSKSLSLCCNVNQIARS